VMACELLLSTEPRALSIEFTQAVLGKGRGGRRRLQR
jgi:hypothetical protein